MDDKAQNAKVLAAAKEPKSWVFKPTKALPVIVPPIEGATSQRIKKQVG
jgi:hypothetical protein